ncbi:MAG: ATP synthase F1 subunit delta [Pseudomonadota bacterium]
MAQDPKTLAARMAHAFQEAVLEWKGEAAAERIRTQLQEMVALSRGNPGAFFANPVFSADEKKKVMEAILNGQTAEPELRRFLELLVALHQLHLLPDISRAYEEGWRARRNEVRASVRTAFPLEAGDRLRLAEALGRVTGKKVLIDEKTDPTLIGGVVAQVGSVVYDASIRGFLNRLQQEF